MLIVGSSIAIDFKASGFHNQSITNFKTFHPTIAQISPVTSVLLRPRPSKYEVL
jgi:hypothetical protein